jgi:hypothetical protein
MALLTTLAASLLCGSFLDTSAASTLAPTLQTPLWKLDVRALGYVTYGVHDPISSQGPLGQFSFAEQDRIIVTFVSHSLSDTLSRRDQPNLPGFRLHALFISAKTGQLLSTQEWPTPSLRSGIIPATRGNFLVVTPDKLILYSPDLRFLKELDIPVAREAPKDDWQLLRSPGGKFLLIDYEVASSEKLLCFEVRDELVDSENLQLVQAWSQFGRVEWEPRSGPCLAPTDHPKVQFWNDVSDDGALLTTTDVGTPAIGHIDGHFHVLCSHNDANCRKGFLVNNQTVIVWPSFHQNRPISLISMSGETLPIQDLSSKEILRSLATSDGGERFAISVERSKGGSELFGIAPEWHEDRIMVYDIPTHKWIYTLDPKKLGVTKISELALSPDGTLLALIDQNGILQVYRIGSGAGKPGDGDPGETGDRRDVFYWIPKTADGSAFELRVAHRFGKKGWEY